MADMTTTPGYVPIQSLDIEAESRITFDLYVNLPLNQKYLLYRRAGGHIESHKMEMFTQSNVSNFYIEKKDYKEFVKYVALRIKSLVGTQNSVENVKLMTAAARSILTSTLNQNDPAIANALMGNLNDITSTIIEGMLENTMGVGQKRLFQRLMLLAEKGSDFQKHPVNVASLAVLITFGIGYSMEKILTDMAMAALLHDVGLSRVPTKSIPYAHDVIRLGIYERDWIYKHPQLTLEILEEKKIQVSDLCKLIILQHHEEFNGSGYPQGLRGFNINELSQILRVADEIDQLFHSHFSSPGNLKVRLEALLDSLRDNKVVEPSLLARIRGVLI